MRVLVHSNAPWAGTGYGQQTNLLTHCLKEAGHETAISAFWGLGGSTLEWNGMKVYPGDEKWGNSWLVGYAADHGDGDPTSVLTLTLMDVWVLVAPLLSTLTMASWVPVDHSPCPPRVAEFFPRTGSTPIAMSRFGEEMLRNEGLDPLYVPHMVDCDLFKPIPQAEARRIVGDLPDDAFVVGMVANNKGNALPRKAFPQVFQAFAKFRKTHPDAYLYLHSYMRAIGDGLDLVALAKLFGIPDEAIRFTPEFELAKGIDVWKMPWVYNTFDVLINPSLGEGFGIPIVEAQACGVPVIVTDFSAMPELVGDGIKVPGWPLYDPAHGSYFSSPHEDAIVDALEAMYERRGQGPSQAARDKALEYDIPKVWGDHWTPALATLEQKMAERRVMPVAETGVVLNRKQRRAKQAAG